MSYQRRIAAIAAVVAVLVTSSVALAQRALRVEIGDVAPYSYKNVLTMRAPSSWTLKKNASKKEVILYWADKTGNALLIVDVFDLPKSLSQAQQKQLLEKFLQQKLGTFKDFKQKPVETRSGAQAAWSYASEVQDLPLKGDSFAKVFGKRLVLITIGGPAEQWGSLRPDLMRLVDSIKVLSGAL